MSEPPSSDKIPRPTPHAIRPRGGTRRVKARSFGPRVGRVVRLFMEGGFGFIKTAKGHLAYFEFKDVAGDAFGLLKTGLRVRYELRDTIMPWAKCIAPEGPQLL